MPPWKGPRPEAAFPWRVSRRTATLIRLHIGNTEVENVERDPQQIKYHRARTNRQFAQRRHAILAGNVANMSTPGYKTRDLSVDDFQTNLKKAIESEKQVEQLRLRPMESPTQQRERRLTPSKLRSRFVMRCPKSSTTTAVTTVSNSRSRKSPRTNRCTIWL